MDLLTGRARVWASNLLAVAVVSGLLWLLLVGVVLPARDKAAALAAATQLLVFEWLPTAAVVVVTVFLGGYVGTAVHEAGHALTAWYVRSRVSAVRIGSGRLLGTVSLGGTRISLHAGGGGGGKTFFTPPATRAQERLVTLAGPRADLLLGTLYLIGAVLTSGLARIIAVLLAVMQVMHWRVNSMAESPQAGQSGSDGWRLARLDAGEHSRHPGFTCQEHWSEALRRSAAGECDEILQAVDRTAATLSPAKVAVWRPFKRLQVLSAAGRFPEALVAVNELAQADKDGELAAFIALSRVDLSLSAGVLSGETPAPAELEEYARVLSDLPDELAALAEVEHTRALLLLAHGRAEDAVAAARSAREGISDPSSLAVVDATIAIALERSGQRDPARAALERVPEWCPLYGAARRELDG